MDLFFHLYYFSKMECKDRYFFLKNKNFLDLLENLGFTLNNATFISYCPIQFDLGVKLLHL
jgi:hypothetical protein